MGLAASAWSSQGPGAAPGLRVIDLVQVPAVTVPRFGRLDLQFDVAGTRAVNRQWPFDPAPPHGVPAGAGISVDAVFTDPAGRRFAQPAFYAEAFDDGIRDGRDWNLPTGRFAWHVRFTPDQPGPWTYTIVARDAGGRVETDRRAFDVASSPRRGFIRVSKADPRYFEFDDGTLFTGLGFEFPEFLDDPVTKGAPAYRALAGYGVNFARVWIASLFGSAWTPWIGGRNQYRGYLPVTGLVPYTDTDGRTALALRLDQEPEGDTGWFDACRMQFWDDPESVEPGRRYRLRVEYAASDLEGPRDPRVPAYGLVAKIGGWHADCYRPGAGAPATGYGRDTDGWGAIEGTWDSGDANFLPRVHLALENVTSGAAYVRGVSLREDLGGGRLGPELMDRPSMAYDAYVPEGRAHAFDRIVEAAERSGVALKIVVGDRNDKVYLKIADDGDWVTGDDNVDGYYGTGRRVNRIRWLQQAWWRYLQARWGYSTSVHSWELMNEGDPNSTRHYEQADEFGKFMRCRVFGVEVGEGDGARCGFQHPDAHLVTTSFWRGLPADAFWNDPRYPNLDYVDLHAYVSTSEAPDDDRRVMEDDAAFFHLWHSRQVAGAGFRKPAVRGEAGLDTVDAQDPAALGLARDTRGVWLHNFLWSGLDAGALYELYWWNSHVWNDAVDHRGAYAAVASFLADIPLNRGGYADWGGTVSTDGVRVVGQKNTATGRAHLWIQNRRHTWRASVAGAAPAPVSAAIDVPAPVSAAIDVPGFAPDAAVRVEWWDTWAPGGRVTGESRLRTDARGTLRIDVEAIQADVALKVFVETPGAR
ncbi:MAG: DUF5060 domain-containing protein [Vicinamibacterales bacterium]